ncbi:MAG: response regulator [Spirochaetes bacterium]|nr:response regulator [Spirochaetota bacterium]
MKGALLIVDDNRKVYESLARNFEHFAYTTYYAANSDEAVRALLSTHVDAVLLDIMLGRESGVDTLRLIEESAPSVPVIMITGYASIESAIETMKLGAYDYVKKPLDFEHLLKVVQNAVEVSRLKKENSQLKERLLDLSPQPAIRSTQMTDVVHTAAKLAKVDLPVLIVGENGTGKEIVADYIHAHSSRAGKRMVKVNCAAFPESLLDNELFGHEKGAYTGADTAFQGVFERANGSSLFLDEIGDMPLTIQAKILRTLQNNEIRRLGGQNTLTVDVRFVAATNRNPESLVAEGRFREDLFYRLNTAVLEVPPLRERKEDLPALVEAFLKEFAVNNDTPLKKMDEQTLQRLLAHDWPGNVRELKNCVSYAAAISPLPVIRVPDLPPALFREPGTERRHNVRHLMERNLIVQTLEQTGQNKKRTAELLQMSRKTLYSKLKRYGLYA